MKHKIPSSNLQDSEENAWGVWEMTMVTTSLQVKRTIYRWKRWQLISLSDTQWHARSQKYGILLFIGACCDPDNNQSLQNWITNEFKDSKFAMMESLVGKTRSEKTIKDIILLGDHFIWQQNPLFLNQGMLDRLHSITKVSFPWEQEGDVKVRFGSGIPPHIAINV